MIGVKITLYPGGTDINVRSLGEMEISNDMTGDLRNGNYRAEVSWPNGRGGMIRRQVLVEGFNRNLSAWELIRRVLEQVAFESQKGIVW